MSFNCFSTISEYKIYRQLILNGKYADLCFQEIALRRGGDTVKRPLQVPAFLRTRKRNR